MFQGFRRRTLSGLIVVFLSSSALAAPIKALGVPVDERGIHVSEALVKQLPNCKRVWVVQPTQMSKQGEELVVYATRRDKYSPAPHLAVLQNGGIAADFALEALFPAYDPSDTPNDKLIWSYFPSEVATLPLGDDRLIGVVFFHYGDLNSTLFVVLARIDETYKVVLSESLDHGRLKVTDARSGGVELWTALDDGLCNACATTYEVRGLEWRAGAFHKLRRWRTLHALGPNVIESIPFAEQIPEVTQ